MKNSYVSFQTKTTVKHGVFDFISFHVNNYSFSLQIQKNILTETFEKLWTFC